MHLRNGEEVLKVVRRHRTPFLLTILKTAVVIIPLYIIAYYTGDVTSAGTMWILFAILSFFVGIIIGYIMLNYHFDRLIITNKRVMWINWKSPIHSEEHEAEHSDIQDIDTEQHGVLSRLGIFDYGYIVIKTAASKKSIEFTNCPSPGEIEHLIVSEVEKHRVAEKESKPQGGENDGWSVN